MYQFCEGVISICPVVPQPRTDLPYHKNIRICGNTFDTPAVPVLYAFSTGDLTFEDNLLFISPTAAPWHPRKSWMHLAYSSDIRIHGNTFVGGCDGLALGINEQPEMLRCERVTLD